jgi:hypothetical protein
MQKAQAVPVFSYLDFLHDEAAITEPGIDEE